MDSIRVLCVEDHAQAARVIKEMLLAAGEPRFDVVMASTLAQGIETVRKGGIDVVLLDLGLPDSRGMRTFDDMHAAAAGIPVVILTAHDDDMIAAAAIRGGAQDYLVKGMFDVAGLAHAVRRAVQRGQQDGDEFERISMELDISEARFRDMIEKNADAIVIVDGRGVIRYANAAAEELFGRDRAGLVGEEFGFPLEAGERNEIKIIRKGPEPATAEMRVVDMEWQGRKCHLATLRDVTERINAREAILRLQARLEAMYKSTSDGIVFTDLEGNVKEANDAALRMHGYDDPNDILGRSALLFISPSEHAQALEGMARTMEEGKSGTLEYTFLRRDGTAFPGELSATLLKDSDGKARGLVAITKDITERKESVEKIRKAMEGAVQALAATVEMRDPYTAGHQRRVADLARAMAEEMGLGEERVVCVHLAARIHDIGKIYVPAEILSKPARLNKSEFEIIQTHPQVGFDILKTVEFPWPIASIIVQHHERMDGSGYPAGLSGDEILVEARIMAVADVVEAMASHRPYRPALGIDAALDEVERNRGKLYDAEAVDACLKVFREKGFKLT
jgi:PAS domain S-box-containing protein/putative nucleotidyltransferase with HDIG domain